MRQLAEVIRASTGDIGDFGLKDSSYIPSTVVHDPFYYLPPSIEFYGQPKKKRNIKNYFTPTTNSSSTIASQCEPSLTLPTLDTLEYAMQISCIGRDY